MNIVGPVIISSQLSDEEDTTRYGGNIITTVPFDDDDGHDTILLFCSPVSFEESMPHDIPSIKELSNEDMEILPIQEDTELQAKS